MAYYITGNGGKGKFYFGKVVHDYLAALILLDEARRAMPSEDWGIATFKI